MKIINHLPILPPVKRPFSTLLEEIDFRLYTYEKGSDGFSKRILFHDIFNMFNIGEGETFLNITINNDNEDIKQSIEVFTERGRYEFDTSLNNKYINKGGHI